MIIDAGDFPNKALNFYLSLLNYKKVIKTNKKLILTTFIGMILLSNVVFAVITPLMPHQFYGSVTYNGQPAPDGLSVVAKIDGDVVASITTKNGRYGSDDLDGDGKLEPEETFLISDSDGDPGDTINFFVNGIDTGQTDTFYNGKVSMLDLSVNGPPIATTTTTGGTGGGGGGGGGTRESEETTTTTTIVTQTTVQGCQEKWTCTGWSACINGFQTRTCTDQNNCGTDLYQPFESQPCVVEEAEGEALSITGLLSLIPSQAIIGFVALTLIFVIFFGWRKVFRKKTTSGMNELL